MNENKEKFSDGNVDAYCSNTSGAMVNLRRRIMYHIHFFDSGNKPSGQAEPELLSWFVLGMVVNLADTYKVLSNRESGYSRYDVMLEPLNKTGKAFIFEFKVLDPDEDEKTLEDTLANTHAQIENKEYKTELLSDGFAPEQIRKYWFAFRGKECRIG